MAALDSEAAHWVRALDLRPHPEGGYYRETYRAQEVVAPDGLPERYDGPRCWCTAILFLLPRGEISAFHRLRSDELWHYHAGARLEICMLAQDGSLRSLALGPDASLGEQFQAVVPGGTWFAARTRGPQAWSLVGCTVAPGFEFSDFELGDRASLVAQYPEHRQLIEKMTRRVAGRQPLTPPRSRLS